MVQQKHKVLIIGNGGREHCLAQSFSRSSLVDTVYVLPGMCHFYQNVVNIDLDPNDLQSIINWSKSNNIDMVIPGGESLLVNGIVDKMKSFGIDCFGPTKKAARIEGSKSFAKDFMKKYNIPTADYQTFDDAKKAFEYIDSINHDFVIKVSGPASGKGVFLPNSLDEAYDIINAIMIEKKFGESGDKIIIEQKLLGEELSIMCFCDGYTIKSMLAAQDHKRINDDDEGPNTGGMGAYSPVSLADDLLIETINKDILVPTIKNMRKENMPFKGVLFVGIMVTTNGPYVIEYNVRLGDPETQVVIPLMKNDIYEISKACIDGTLDSINLEFMDKKAVTVVASSHGYPAAYEKGKEIFYDELYFTKNTDVNVYFAGATKQNNKITTIGGRVFSLTAFGYTIDEAIINAYNAMQHIRFENMHYRKDIAKREKKYIKNKLTYKQSGVNINEANNFISIIKPLVKSTIIDGADSEIGGFGGLFDLSKLNYKNPVLVSSTDGVGTKILLTIQLNKYDTIGIDLVAMSVNDLIVQGAKPLFFLDYYSMGKLESSKAKQIIKGIVDGCKESNCALIGGETAEMNILYRKNDYDLAGFCVGIVEKTQILPKLDDMKDGDALIGISSSGIHSNGYSLIHNIIKKNKLSLNEKISENVTETLGEILMKPTRIYINLLIPLINKGIIKAMCHITGGGIIENLPRVLPKNKKAVIDTLSWKKDYIFKYLRSKGNVDNFEMLKTFNCGIGMILIINNENLDEIEKYFENKNEKFYSIGKIKERQIDEHQVHLQNLENSFDD